MSCIICGSGNNALGYRRDYVVCWTCIRMLNIALDDFATRRLTGGKYEISATPDQARNWLSKPRQEWPI